MKKKKWVKRIIYISIFALIIYMIWQWRFNQESTPPDSAKVEKRDVASTVSINATLIPEKFAHITAESPMLAKTVYIDVGDVVEKGDKLIELDRSTMWAQIREAQAGLERAIAEEQGSRRESSRSTKEQRLALKNATEQARQRLNQLYAVNAKNTLTSPIGGVITEVNIREGEVASGILVRVIDPLSLHIESLISESDIVNLRVGQKATMVFDAKTDTEYQATITKIHPEATNIQDVIYFRTLLRLDGDDTRIRPGMSGDITLITEESRNTLAIPIRFFSRDDEGGFTHINTGVDADGEQVYEKIYISTGIEGDDLGYVEVTDSLSLGQEVFVIREEDKENVEE